ncbi:hypothetical protein PENSPDRAFT_738036 [Peniophora sp. CONT]|nr:hypothetical protein PENSPDRAFT_738036 [Peniophora sp. CONT]
MSLVADVSSYDTFEEELDVILHSGMTLQAVKGTSVRPLPFAHCKLDATVELTARGKPNGVAVYRGITRDEHNSNSAPIKVAVKVAERLSSLGELTREAKFYVDRLRGLVDYCVPVCYGVYQVQDPEGGQYGFGCLILEDCGDRVYSFVHYSDEDDKTLFRTRLVNVVFELHKSNVRHGDLQSKHILDKDGWPYLVDFSRATDHACPRASDPTSEIEFGKTLQPSLETFGCQEFYETCVDAKAWLPYTFKCDGTAFPAYSHLRAPRTVADFLMKMDTTGTTPREAIELAHRAICDYYKKHLPEKGEAYEDDLDKNLVFYCDQYEEDYARRLAEDVDAEY